MKHKDSAHFNISQSYTWILVVVFLFVLLSQVINGEIAQNSTNISAVQFDAIIELNRYSPRSSRHDYTMMFARYWVGHDYYSAAVVWAEPQSTDLFFAIRPPTLSVASNEQGFKVHHELNTKYNETYKKPLGRRGVLRYMFGGYPIGNIRFAEQEALAERIYPADLINMDDVNQPDGEPLDITIPTIKDADARDVTRLKVQTNGERIDSMQLFDADKRLLKDISYEHENKERNAHLRKLTAVLPERPMMVGFNTGGMKVTLDGKEYRYRDLEARHHSGGRTCTAEYDSVRMDDKKVTLPVEVTVCNRKDGRILRCVRMMNFRQVELDAAGAEGAARQFGAITVDQRKYEQFRLKYWEKAPKEIEKEDGDSIEQLRGRFEKALASADKNSGEKLKNLNILMELDRIVGDDSELERHYQWYLSMLSENNLPQMTLVGGYGVIETSMFRERHSEAEKILGLWVNAVMEITDAESILLFARRQLAKNRLWTTVKLLEAFSSKKHYSADARFEAETLRCMALGKLCKLMCIDDIAEKGLIAEVQANWVASIGKDNLDIMLAKSIDQARQSFSLLLKPTESQQALKKQLDKIDQEINQEKTSNPS